MFFLREIKTKKTSTMSAATPYWKQCEVSTTKTDHTSCDSSWCPDVPDLHAAFTGNSLMSDATSCVYVDTVNKVNGANTLSVSPGQCVAGRGAWSADASGVLASGGDNICGTLDGGTVGSPALVSSGCASRSTLIADGRVWNMFNKTPQAAIGCLKAGAARADGTVPLVWASCTEADVISMNPVVPPTQYYTCSNVKHV